MCTRSQVNNTEYQNGRWTDEEHAIFLRAIHEKHSDFNWRQISSLIKTRSSEQVRTHAQKYFAKLARRKKRLEKYKARYNPLLLQSSIYGPQTRETSQDKIGQDVYKFRHTPGLLPPLHVALQQCR